MASNTYGAIKLSTAEDVGAVLKKKTGSADGYKPKEWADTINLMGLLPVRTASGSIAHFTDGADDVPLKSLTAQILPKQSGTGTPSPQNPRPISGTSVLNVTQTGANVWNEDWELGGFNSVGEPIPANDRIRSVDFTSIKPNTSYYFKTTNTLDVRYYDVNKDFISSANGTNTALTTPANAYYLKLLILNTTEYANDVSVNYPSTDTSYHAYTGSTYAVNLGQTVYGGSAEVVGGTGEETHKLINLIDLTWTLQNGAFYSQPLTDAKAVTDAQIFNGVSSHFVSVSYNYLYAKVTDNSIAQSSSKRIYIYSSAITTIEQLQTVIADAQLAYELATPTEYTFTGQPINSYLGTNNVWTDSGEVTVEYRADINLLISELGG